MKEELYSYATSLKNNGLQKIPYGCFWVLISVFFVPILLLSKIVGSILFCSFILLYLFIKRETDVYNRNLLKIGLFLLYLGADISILTLIQYRIIIPLVIASTISLISYEIIFGIKVHKKNYTNRKHNKSVWTSIIPMIFGATGIWVGKIIAKSDIVSTDIKLIIIIMFCSFLFLSSFTYFQKVIILKVIK